MANAAPELALVVCTRNRADKLEPFFNAIKQMRSPCAWELVLVDNGSTDKTAECLKAFAATFPGPITLVTELQAGLGRARNTGWRASIAPLLVFTDDDCYPHPEFLAEMKTVFTDSSLGYVGGRILLYDPSDSRVTTKDSSAEEVLQPGQFVPTGFIHGANFAIRRQALMDIAGFDDGLGAGTPFGCEDVDAALRLSAAGWKGKYDPRPLVYHHHRRKEGPEIESLWRMYDQARGAYYLKCLLYLPQRWQCARHWLKSMWRERLARTGREVQSAFRYLFYQFKQKPNRAH